MPFTRCGSPAASIRRIADARSARRCLTGLSARQSRYSPRARLDDAVALLLANGYQQARWFRRMVADLRDGIEERPAPADVEIVRFTAERSNDALLVRNEAFREHWGSTEQTEEGWGALHRLSGLPARIQLPRLCRSRTARRGTRPRVRGVQPGQRAA